MLSMVKSLQSSEVKKQGRMAVEMTGISVRFETRELDGREVLVLRYRLKRFVVVRFFTETYDPCTGEVCSAMDNMVGFVYRLMRFVSEYDAKCLAKGCPTVTLEVQA